MYGPAALMVRGPSLRWVTPRLRAAIDGQVNCVRAGVSEITVNQQLALTVQLFVQGERSFQSPPTVDRVWN